MDVSERLVRYALETQYQDIPSDAIRATKQHLLHTLGVLVAGSSSDGCKTVVDLVTEWGGREESTILVYGNKVPAVNAVLANAMMSHALDFDAHDDRSGYKCSIVPVPTSLNIAEFAGSVTGKDMLTALCIGIELGTRIGLSIRRSVFDGRSRLTHAHARLIAPFAGAFVTGRLLGLNTEQMLDALGIVYCDVSPTGSSTVHPALTKRLKLGLAGRTGVFAALLARKGFKSRRNIFEGKDGFFYIYWGGEGDLGRLTKDLGKRFEMVDVAIKAYPCCRSLQGPIYTTLLTVKEHGIRPEDVVAVRVYMAPHDPLIMKVEANPASLGKLRHPEGLVDAQFSIPWGVATAIVKRNVFIEHFREEARRDGRVIAVAEKVTPIGDPGLKIEDMFLSPTVVVINTTDGQVYSRRVDFPKGNPQNPVTMDETRDNFRRCATYAAKPLPRENVEQIIQVIDHLETVDDVSVLPGLFTI